jgi:hypothetical protein
MGFSMCQPDCIIELGNKYENSGKKTETHKTNPRRAFCGCRGSGNGNSPDDPSEPCLEAETVNMLREIAEHAEHGDRQWIQQKGKVYELIDTV